MSWTRNDTYILEFTQIVDDFSGGRLKRLWQGRTTSVLKEALSDDTF